MKLTQIIYEGGRMAGQALRANPLRSFLSLLGMTLGIFLIISVNTIVDSLEKSIRDSVEQVGSDVLYIQKWPWGGGGEYPWWKIWQHPEPKYEEMGKLKDRLKYADAMSYLISINANLNYRSNTVESVGVAGVSNEYSQIWGVPIEKGRYFSPQESAGGANVALVGHDVAEGLFGPLNPIGKEIRVLGEKVRIIGVFEKEGEKLIGESHDELFVVPVEFMLKKVNEDELQGTIMVKAKEGVDIDMLKDEVEGVMRGIRRLRPVAENNFAINEISVLQNGLDSMFTAIGLGGSIIGGFALLAGGFGIANIMFVSVSERTNQIGVQKALGAKARFILMQFISESVTLSLAGGVLGLLLTYGLVLIADMTTDSFEIFLSTNNIITGLIVSALIGIVFGLLPALRASRMDPVEAIRSS
ncbi:MAG: ABC transporter permease [Flavobacteriia bacterium]|nr:ABC transporter permease [Flavobacteriia bacterium]